MRTTTAVCLGFLGLFLPGYPAAGADAIERMLASKKEVTEYLVREARRITDAAAMEIVSKQAWEPVRDQHRREMLDMLGLDPLPPRTPLQVQITGTVEGDDYSIEKIAFQSLPHVYATANLYVPKKREGPLPAVIYVCGHAYSLHGNKVPYQRHSITLARHGYVALIIDSIQIAETFALHHGILSNEMYDWYARGYTPAGVEVWNVMRALDYLETRPEVDKDRFGITGRSGGAAMSWFAASVEPRIKVAVPVMGISTYAANVLENTQRLHCDCMFTINHELHGMLHQGALIAPRPLYMMHGRQDRLFPVPGYEEFERRVAALYSSYGAAERFKNLVVETGHEDSDLLRAEAVRWFDRWLKGIPERNIDLSYEDLPGEELSVFGGRPPEDALSYRVHEILTAAPPRKAYTSKPDWERRRHQLIEMLSTQVFRAFPAQKTALNSRPGNIEAPEPFEALAFDSEQGITVQTLFREASEEGGPSLLYVASNGDDVVAIRDTLRQIWGSKKNAVMIVFPRGVGEVAWEKTFVKDTLRNAMHTGRTIDSMRLWDVMRAVELLRQRSPERSVVVMGDGVSGVLGLYAALFDDRTEQVILIKPPVSHHEGPIFLNVLRYTDLPEAAALLAPRRLTFYGRVPAEFEFTAGIYNLAGHPDRLSLTMSLEAALNGRFERNFASGL